MTTVAQLLPTTELPPAVAAMAISGLSLDSRKVAHGDAFFALSGAQQDGRDFIPAAVSAGAALVFADGQVEAVDDTRAVPVITLPALRARVGDIAARFHGGRIGRLAVAGVTGTNGKSSTAWYLRDALAALGHRCALVGTLGMDFEGQHIDSGHTTPDVLTLHAGLADFADAGADSVVMEVSSHALVQQRLSGVPMQCAIFTNLSRDHLDYHGSMDAYFDAKAALFDWPGLALAVINTADEWGQRLWSRLDRADCKKVSFAGADADVRLSDARLHDAGVDVALSIAGESVQVNAALYGQFNIDNLMAVAATLHGQGMCAADIERALAAVTPVPGRMAPVPAAGGPRVLVDYAHTPDGLEKALQACRAHFSGRLWCLIGCGGDRDTGKRPMMASVAQRLADQCVFTSDNPRSEAPEDILADMLAGVSGADNVISIVDRAEAIAHVIAEAADDDLVLLAGKGHECWQEIGGTKLPFDDRDIAASALQQRLAGRSS